MIRDRRPPFAVGCFALALALLAASCSDDGGSGASTDSSAGTSTSAVATTTTTIAAATTTSMTSGITTTSPVATTIATTTLAPTTTQAPPSSAATGPLSIDLDVDALVAAGAPRVVTVVADSQMEINATSASSQEYHLHGYDIEVAGAPGKEVTFAFTASDKGEFELETHGASTVLLILKVV